MRRSTITRRRCRPARRCARCGTCARHGAAADRARVRAVAKLDVDDGIDPALEPSHRSRARAPAADGRLPRAAARAADATAVAAPVATQATCSIGPRPCAADIEQQRIARKCGVQRDEAFSAAARRPVQAAIGASADAPRPQRRTPVRPGSSRLPIVHEAVDAAAIAAVADCCERRHSAVAAASCRTARSERAVSSRRRFVYFHASSPSRRETELQEARERRFAHAHASRGCNPCNASSCVRSRAERVWRGVAFTRPAPPVAPSRNRGARARARGSCRRCAGFGRPTARARSPARCSRAAAGSASRARSRAPANAAR